MFPLSADEYNIVTLRRGEKNSDNCEDAGRAGGVDVETPRRFSLLWIEVGGL